MNPSELNNFTDKQLQALHDSLGITTETEKDVRFEAVHMRGTDDMSTEDVLEYFGKYGPAAIEWIDDSSCNVLWYDKISAARALFFLSKAIKGMPIEGPRDPFLKELTVETEDKENEGRSILLKNQDREVELRDDTDDIQEEDESISVSDVPIPIPPGFWRLGNPSDKSKWILLRFAHKSDRKPHKAERFSEYYKKYGNPNYGGLKGFITETHKKKFKGIFDRNKDIKESVDPKNPWGSLAKDWNADFKYCEKIITTQPVITKGKSDIMSRLGFKRLIEDETEGEGAQKKTKMPRMRMYADEEEEKIKRKKELQKVKLHSNTSEAAVDDLRYILQTQLQKPVEEIKDELESTEVDLATRLTNRSRNTKLKPVRKTSKEEIDSDKHKEYKIVEKIRLKEKSRHSPRNKYEQKMYSDKFSGKSRSHHYTEKHFDTHKPRSRIAVVVKTQKTPAVASTVWSRVNSERDRLKTVSESKLRYTRSSSSESSSSSSSGSSSESSSSDSSEDEAKMDFNKRQIKSEKLEEDGDRSLYRKNSLRLEIDNDYFTRK